MEKIRRMAVPEDHSKNKLRWRRRAKINGRPKEENGLSKTDRDVGIELTEIDKEQRHSQKVSEQPKLRENSKSSLFCYSNC